MSMPRNPDTDPKPEPPQSTGDDDSPGTNKVQHKPDPNAQPVPEPMERKYHPRSPYTTGNT